MQKILKIGTRDSKLAMYQTKLIKKLLEEKGYNSEIVKIKSKGDKDRKKPIYEMGITGVFTKELDESVINNEVDLVVHSFKDIPTKLAKGLIIASVPERKQREDILIYKNSFDSELKDKKYVFGTSSLRRGAGLLSQYPNCKIENLRGNIEKRLQKLKENKNWDGAVFAKTAITRLRIERIKYLEMDFLISSPAQGAIAITCKKDDSFTKNACESINNNEAFIETYIEKQFMAITEAGCSMPIGASAKINGENIEFIGQILSNDGKQNYKVKIKEKKDNYKNIANIAFKEITKNGKVVNLLKNFKKGVL